MQRGKISLNLTKLPPQEVVYLLGHGVDLQTDKMQINHSYIHYQ